MRLLSQNRARPAWRKTSVPAGLRGKSAEDIRGWARQKLDGEEPDLKQADVRGIRNGEIGEILLKPKKAGFFMPDGTFVEALGSIRLSEDIDEADSAMEDQERDNDFCDEENGRFNKQTAAKDGSPTDMLQLWEHGKRIEEYAGHPDRPPFRLHQLLQKRAGINGYSLRAHQAASELFRWKKTAQPTDPVFGWPWQIVDAILKISKLSQVRGAVAKLIEDHLHPRGATWGQMASFFRGPGRGSKWSQSSDGWAFGAVLQQFEQLRKGAVLSAQEVEQLLQALAGRPA